MGCSHPGLAGGIATRRGLSGGTYVAGLKLNPASHGRSSSIHFASAATSFPLRASPLGGIRVSASLLVMRLMSSLEADLPGTAAFDFRSSSRVSNETPPLYVPLVWHFAHFAFRMGTISCANRSGFSAAAPERNSRQ